MSQYYQNLLEQYGTSIHKLYYDERLSQHGVEAELHLPKGSVGRIMKLANWPARSDREQALKYACNEHFFDAIDTEEKAYWLGFMYADGYIMQPRKHSNFKVGISLSIKDIAHLEKFKASLSTNARITTYRSTTSFADTEYARVLISSNILAKALIDKGCAVSKTSILEFPSEDIVPSHLLRHFVRGCIDGDGCITRTIPSNPNHCYEYALKFCGTLSMVEGVKAFLGCSHLSNCRRYKDRNNNNYDITIGGNRKAFAALDLLYDNCTIYLERKYQRYLQYKQEYIEYNSRAAQ